ncbi:MAG: MBL fold metallo-hydrolase [Flavitalea sp.]
MKRRSFLKAAGIFAGSGLIYGDPLFAFQDKLWKINMLTPETGLFTERGGAILFNISKEGIVVVDSQFPAQAANLIAEMKNRTDKTYRLLINTHHHTDHSGGNIAFKDLTKHILAHENSKLNQQSFAQLKNTEAGQLYPNQTYDKKWCETIGGQTICLHYFGAGHTNGDSVVHFEKDNVAHMGDLCFNHIYPNIDASAGASMKSWINVLDKTYKLLDRKTRVICSHGNPVENVIVDREFLKEQKLFFEKTFDFVEMEIKAGKSRDEIIANTSIPGNEQWKDEWKFAKVNLAMAFDETQKQS